MVILGSFLPQFLYWVTILENISENLGTISPGKLWGPTGHTIWGALLMGALAPKRLNVAIKANLFAVACHAADTVCPLDLVGYEGFHPWRVEAHA